MGWIGCLQVGVLDFLGPECSGFGLCIQNVGVVMRMQYVLFVVLCGNKIFFCWEVLVVL